MIITQEEAKAWSEILKGFSEGKEYQIPIVSDSEGNVFHYSKITDFAANPQCPVIWMTYCNDKTPIDVRDVSEVKK